MSILFPQWPDPYDSSWKNPLKQLPDGAWEEWGRNALLFSADGEDCNLKIFLINTEDLNLYHVVDFSHQDFNRVPEPRSAACAMVGSQVYIIGGFGDDGTGKRLTDVYVCDLSKSLYEWATGPPLLKGMVYPQLLCLDKKIYALDLPDGDSGGSFQMLDPGANSGSWQMLPSPPFFPLNEFCLITGTACIGNKKIVFHVFECTSIEVCYDLAIFHLYDAEQKIWSILKRVKIPKHGCLYEGIYEVAAAPVPYRAYAQDICLLSSLCGQLFVFDFKAFLEGDPDENPDFLYHISDPNRVHPWFLGTGKVYLDWHMHHLGGTKFCLVFACGPDSCTPLVEICSFDLVIDKVDSYELSSEDADDSGEDGDDSGQDDDADETDGRKAFKVEGFKENTYECCTMGFFPESCLRPSYPVAHLSMFS